MGKKNRNKTARCERCGKDYKKRVMGKMAIRAKESTNPIFKDGKPRWEVATRLKTILLCPTCSQIILSKYIESQKNAQEKKTDNINN